MPPWYVEKNIGIQKYKDDLSLKDDELAKIARWVETGAPQGNPADMPPPLKFESANVWRIGKPDLILRLPDLVVKANSSDFWGPGADLIPVTGLTEDRYIAALEMKEVNDVDQHPNGRKTVGGKYVIHHLTWSTMMPDANKPGVQREEDDVTGWPIHEVGRNPDYFDPRGARLLKKGSSINISTLHLHSNGADTTAHLEIGFKFMPKDYKPAYKTARVNLGNGMDMDIQAN